MSESELDFDSLEKLIRIVEARDLTELVVEEGDLKVTIRGSSYLRAASHAPAQPPAVSLPPVLSEEVLEDPAAVDEGYEEEPDERILVVSPVVGVFYRSSGPDTPPYVEVGDHVDTGQIIGLIEAMKVFSEVPSESSGTVVAIAASNGQLVRTGDPLIYLRAD